MTVCRYCGRERVGDGVCLGCGAGTFVAPLPDKTQRDYGYFPYNGFIVWVWCDDVLRIVEYRFYSGDRLVDVIPITRRALDDLIPCGHDVMPFVWELFLISQGENKEYVLEISSANKSVRPGRFRITRDEDTANIEVGGIKYDDLIRLRDRVMALPLELEA